ncbi:MAG TPA: lysylphosphatidylglycerol synthase transmembrane domain-containing protein [Candidatus Saccharimonadales bacterium]
MKPLLLVLAVLLSAAGIYMAQGMLGGMALFLMSHPLVAGLVAVSVLIQLAGHFLRAKRTKLILDQAAKSSMKFQFGALSIGYLFNILLPFRVGELVRSYLVARRLHISLLYTFSAVVIERATDVVFLGALLLIGFALMGIMHTGVLMIALAAMLLATILLWALWLLKNENKQLLMVVSAIANLFNASIANRIRFKVWSLIFGLQSFFGDRRQVKNYILYAVTSWLLYFVSVLMLVVALLPVSSALQAFVASLSPYVVSLSPLDASSYQQLANFLPVKAGAEVLDVYARLVWALLLLPTAFIGLVALLFYRPGTKQTAKRVKTDPYINKLMRHQDISQEFPAFLDSYFAGNSLARTLHKLEITGKLRLVKYFKGGSDAITVLVLSGDELYVKKIIPLEYQDRLKAQYDWLQSHSKMRNLVKVIGEEKTNSYYAIDLQYDPENVPFFEYIHHSSVKESREIIEKIWKSLYDHLHKKAPEPTYNAKARTAFINKHIYGCVEKAAIANDDIRVALGRPIILVNGVEYDNLQQIMAKIKANKQAWRDIATFRHSPAVHGDASVDNFLVSPSKKKVVIIDPAPDGNIINGPVFEFGKLAQSFYCGYEFLFRDEDIVRLEGKNIIKFREHASARYLRLWQFIHNELAPRYISEAERRAMLFHAGALYIRRLKHQVYYNPGNALKFYAVGVKALNEFLAQYEPEG